MTEIRFDFNHLSRTSILDGLTRLASGVGSLGPGSLMSTTDPAIKQAAYVAELYPGAHELLVGLTIPDPEMSTPHLWRHYTPLTGAEKRMLELGLKEQLGRVAADFAGRFTAEALGRNELLAAITGEASWVEDAFRDVILASNTPEIAFHTFPLLLGGFFGFRDGRASEVLWNSYTVIDLPTRLDGGPSDFFAMPVPQVPLLSGEDLATESVVSPFSLRQAKGFVKAQASQVGKWATRKGAILCFEETARNVGKRRLVLDDEHRCLEAFFLREDDDPETTMQWRQSFREPVGFRLSNASHTSGLSSAVLVQSSVNVVVRDEHRAPQGGINDIVDLRKSQFFYFPGMVLEVALTTDHSSEYYYKLKGLFANMVFHVRRLYGAAQVTSSSSHHIDFNPTSFVNLTLEPAGNHDGLPYAWKVTGNFQPSGLRLEAKAFTVNAANVSEVRSYVRGKALQSLPSDVS